MDSSSSDSFAWTPVLSESADSDLDSTMRDHNKISVQNGEEDETSDSPRKKKIKVEEANDDTIHKKKKKKKKDKSDSNQDISLEDNEYLNMKVKQEHDDTIQKKKKKKKEKFDGNQDISLEDYEYLNMKVKQEQDYYLKTSSLKTKKRKKDSSEIEDDNNLNECNVTSDVKKKKKKKNESNGSVEIPSFFSDDDETVTNTKKQKNSKKESGNNSLVIKDIFSAEETDVQKMPTDDKPAIKTKKHKIKKRHDSGTEESANNSLVIEDKLCAGETEVQKMLTGDDETATQSKKRKIIKRNNSEAEESDNNSHVIKDKFSAGETEVQKMLTDDDDSATQLKKHKIKKRNNSETEESDNNGLVIEDKFSAEETVIQKMPTVSDTYETNNIQLPRCNINDEDKHNEQLSNAESSASNHSDNHLKTPNGKEIKSPLKKGKNDALHSNPEKSLNNTNSPSKKKHETPTILDRIRFEEDNDLDIAIIQNNHDKETKNVQKYLKSKNFLKPMSGKLNHGQKITDNDELWLLKCPQELDIRDFKNKDLTLDSKSKIKVNSETFIGGLDEDISRITILTTDENRFILKKIHINGLVTLRKRLPKPHLIQDNVIVNRDDFIPLPETKCRHPLLGFNYKNLLKVTSSIAQRLHTNEDVSTSEDVSMSLHSDKKKKKKQKKVIDDDFETKIEVKSEPEANGPTKKAKKRKRDYDIETSVKKAKQKKQEPDSSDVWESEKAIEENLFNF